MNVIFIPTTPQILNNFKALLPELTNRGIQSYFILLNGIVTSTIQKKIESIANIQLIILNKNQKKTFLVRNSITDYIIYNKIIRKECKSIFNGLNTDTVIVSGNDCSPLIRLILRVAHKYSIKRLLLQDGFLRKDAILGYWRIKKNRFNKVVLIVQNFLRHLGFDNYFYSYYGNSSDYVAVYGEITKELFVQADKVDQSKIFITGSPRHQLLLKEQKEKISQSEKIIVTYFSIGSIDGKYGIKMQKQELFIIDNIIRIVGKYKDDIDLVIRLRPSEKVTQIHYNAIKNLNNNVDFKFSDENESIEEVLAYTNFAVAGPSTALIDTIFYGIPSFQIYSASYKNSFLPNIPLIKDDIEFDGIMVNLIKKELDFNAYFSIIDFEKTIKNINPSFDSIIKTVDFIQDIAKQNAK